MSATTVFSAPSDFCFPPTQPPSETGNEKFAISGTSLSRKGSSHSRQYTVNVPDLASPEDNQSNAYLSPYSANPSSPGVSPRNSPRKHAHRRSAAVSNDLGIDFSIKLSSPSPPPPPFIGKPIQPPPPLLQKNSPTSFHEASSSPTLTLVSSNSEQDSISSGTRNNRIVSFAPVASPRSIRTATNESTCGSGTGSTGGAGTTGTDTETTGALGTTGTGTTDKATKGTGMDASGTDTRTVKSTKHTKSMSESKHKKVRSWAGSLIKFTRSSSQQRPRAKSNNGTNHVSDLIKDQDMQSRDNFGPTTTKSANNFISSSYVPIYSSVFDLSDDEPEPTIDLDAALGPFRTPQALFSSPAFETMPFHRRSESAPEAAAACLGPNFRYMKRRRMGPVFEEEDDKDGDSPGIQFQPSKVQFQQPQKSVKPQIIEDIPGFYAYSSSQQSSPQAPDSSTFIGHFSLGEPGPASGLELDFQTPTEGSYPSTPSRAVTPSVRSINSTKQPEEVKNDSKQKKKLSSKMALWLRRYL